MPGECKFFLRVQESSKNVGCEPFFFSGLAEKVRATYSNPRAGFLPGQAADSQGGFVCLQRGFCSFHFSLIDKLDLAKQNRALRD